MNQAAHLPSELTRQGPIGRTGVQALLIEQALPEIEDEANRLLARMTDNRMHLKFDTQRENKKGNTVETLDINMSGVEFNDAESARVRFYPNGVSDEMRMILFDGRERMGIELEITTGLANVVPDPLREWVRR